MSEQPSSRRLEAADLWQLARVDAPLPSPDGNLVIHQSSTNRVGLAMLGESGR